MLVLLLGLLLAMTPTPPPQPLHTDPDLGVSRALATSRAARLSNVAYELSLAIPAGRHQAISGREVVSFDLRDRTAPVALDFGPDAAAVLRRVESGGRQVDVRQVNGHIILPRTALKAGRNAFVIEFVAGNGPLNRNDDYLYTIFVPARAHEAFPCFDQPDLKARLRLTLEVPDGWETLANGAEEHRQTVSGRTRVVFAETKPIPTYLFAFAAGHFFVETGVRNGRTFRMFHRETDAEKVARNRDAIFDLHAAALAWLEKYTGIPYPFGKFDFLLVPAFQFGGMEHPGAIFYNASGLMLDESATQNQKLERASTISHETSHIWFGDLVTMKWFNDVWMKEVFANFMAAKIVNPSFPHINHDLRFLLSYYPSAYDVDRTAGTNEIRQPLENLSEAGTLYGAIIYQKAPIVMRQLETIVGPDKFQEGLREYLKQYAYGNATWPDLIGILDPKTPENLAAWSHAWVEERGRPTIATALRTSHGRIDHLAFDETDPIQARGLLWSERMQVSLGYADHVENIPVRLDAHHVVVRAAKGKPAPLYVLPNGGGIAYGDIRLDRASLDYLLDHADSIPDELTRGAAWVTLWDEMLDGNAAPSRFVTLTTRAVAHEPNELNVQRMLGYLSGAFWHYLTPDQRHAVGPSLERTLKDGLAAAPSQSLKSAWFSALRDTAQTPDTLEWLVRVWKRQVQIPGLTFAEPDYIRLAEELAVRDVPDTPTLLEQQYERIQNPDRKAQFGFVRPALSPDPADRDKWFAALSDLANRRHEAWVLDGLRYLHHPLRAASSEKYILPSLELLREIQRTGDIFFPKRWTDATLSGHSSPAAAATVRQFLRRLPPTYPERLRRIILSSADELFRSERVQHGARSR